MSTVAGAPASGRVVLPDEVCAAMVGASVRVTGNVAKIDAAAGTATLEQSELVIDLSNCGTCSGVDGHHGGGGAPPVVGRTFQFIGEVVRREVGAGVAVAARISRDVTGIDMPLYANAVRLRRARGYP
uniref:CST complex subunit CTC1 n=1 Tax=Prasinoderma coloniale TaxID=156133 RepID=A0A7R9T8W4_9VIRI|mmetsp:Transcript_10727/g.44351  ORF Transcript_10727/g.44351 Transcript_10727/m.44351 type:complete len:128 (+) Transcript_10727:268-651(+)